MMQTYPVVNTYPLSSYSFGTKEPKMEKDTSVADRLARMKLNYMKEGMRTSVEAILLVQEHNHPHILLLQIGNTFSKLPGGRLKPGENEIEGLKRKLSSKLAANQPGMQPEWQIGECVAMWWRPNFETIMYPYCPPHIMKPKECKKLYIVHLSEREYFAVPKNLKLLAVPLFELYDNVQDTLVKLMMSITDVCSIAECLHPAIVVNDVWFPVVWFRFHYQLLRRKGLGDGWGGGTLHTASSDCSDLFA
ncbi:hypothetical protein KSS87_018299 [Heliosperma pusillum]|nr:hypothetical protein KSS87_018299 [Heliosperma pusillum]